jgi:hypothetical protein
MVRPLLAAALLAIASGTAGAQSTPAARPAAVQTLSVNPLYVPFGGIVLEFERATASRGLSVGFGAAHYDPVGDDDDTYSSAEAKLRFYPGERAPRGFSLGLTAGVGRADGESCCTRTGEVEDRVRTGATAGVVLDYNWLIGQNRRFFVGTGIGAKRLFGDLGNNEFFDIEVVPLARLQVGVAF